MPENKSYILSPSILALNFLDLRQKLTLAYEAGVRWIHYDVMDYQLVSNLTFGPKVLADLKSEFDFFYDCHMMIKPWDNNDFIGMLQPFVKAGANSCTLHVSSFQNAQQISEFIRACRDLKIKAALAIENDAEVEVVAPWLDQLYIVQVMSVKPGFGGQAFQDRALSMIKKLRLLIDNQNFKTLIEVDGGINNQTGLACKKAGADVLVAGTYFFTAKDFKKVFNELTADVPD